MARTITFKKLLHGVAIRLGLDPTVDLERNQAAALSEYLSDSYEVAYEWYEWPESVCIEQVTALDQVIEWDQTRALDGIGTPFCLSVEHPQKSANPTWVDFELSADGLIVAAAYASSELWLAYRPPAPEFTTTEYSATATYAVGDLVYYTTDGHCYRCIVATTAGTAPSATSSYWKVVPVLKVLQQAAVQGALSEALREEGQSQTALMPDEHMAELLGGELDRLELQAGQNRTLRHRRPS